MKPYIFSSPDFSLQVALYGESTVVTIDGVHAYVFRNGVVFENVLADSHGVHAETNSPATCPGCRPMLRELRPRL